MILDPVDLVRVLLGGPWRAPLMERRIAAECGWLRPTADVTELVNDVVARWPEPPPPGELLGMLAGRRELTGPVLHPVPPPPPPPPRIKRGRLVGIEPPLRTLEDLQALLWLDAGELDWFADRQQRNPRAPTVRLQHYRYRVVGTADRPRLLEIPKARLKEIQRRLRESVLTALPLHPATHGAVAGRSVASCLAPHAGAGVVVRCDLESFFPSITADRVAGQLRLIGLSPELCSIIAGLTTSAVPYPVRSELPSRAGDAAHWRWRRRLAAPHLPQGSPSSPVLANAIGYSLDLRLTALTHHFGGRYTRYVDDLIFSGPESLPVGALLAGVRTIVRGESFTVNEDKTRVLRTSRRQVLLGAVLNDRPRLSRVDRDRLRAIVHNCRVHGPDSQRGHRDREAFRGWLVGRVGWACQLDPDGTSRLRAEFEAIDWTR